MEKAAPNGSQDSIDYPVTRIFLVEDATGKEVDILHESMEVDRLIEWILNNAVRISTELPPFDLKEGESIAAGYARVLAVLPRIEEITGSVDILAAAADVMVGYQICHSIHRALGGMNLPKIYLGVSPAGAEISCADGGDWDWKYDLVGYEEFLVWLSQQIRHSRLPAGWNQTAPSVACR
ncbi:hypothetical protein [Gordonia humi]|uniref:Uncharacterized protein n=1 Tax=Gordonia humi TaxID=686429 RepID=A0A840EPM5_9ACTN|nr:hypothetical protein [Gordonia humi]MBB4133642.1 hypothetical protein [Gordonia humi]